MSPRHLLIIGQILILLLIFYAFKKTSIPLTTNQTIPSSPASSLSSPVLSPSRPLQWGAYVGSELSQLQEFQTKVQKDVDIIAVFVHWANENQLPSDLAQAAQANDKTLLVYWEAMDYNVPGADPRFSYDQILSGTYDKYIKSFAFSLKNYSSPVILVPFEEMNSNWYSWSVTINGNTPQKHIEAYRYLHDFFKDIPNVKFAWAVNHNSVPDTPENHFLNYYPGNDYVDIVGVDGFNFGDPWQKINQIFDRPLSQLATLNKPMMIFSMACAPGPQKSDWIKEAAVYLKTKPNLIAWIWFNENKEKDWRVWSDPLALQSFSQDLINLNSSLPGSP